METNGIKITKRSTTLPERQEIIQRWKDSGKSRKEFCSENDINYYTLVSWTVPVKRKKTSRPKSVPKASGFKEVKLTRENTGLFARVSCGDTTVELYQAVSFDFFKGLLSS